jgi:hypothetical protein
MSQKRSKNKKSQTTSQHSSKNLKSRQKQAREKERGWLLSLVLVIMALHGLAASYFYINVQNMPEVQKPFVIWLMVLHSLANVVAAIGIWNWKKWALYVYAGSTIASVVAGLLSIGAWSVFYMVLPLAIVGWLLRTKWEYFD